VLESVGEKSERLENEYESCCHEKRWEKDKWRIKEVLKKRG